MMQAQSLQLFPSIRMKSVFVNVRLGTLVSAMGSMVVGLFVNGSPLAIFRRVWAVIVNAVDSRSWWPWPHVSEEVVERVKPSVTDRDTAATPSIVGIVVCVVAAT